MTATPKKIASLDDISLGVLRLTRDCPHMKAAYGRTGMPPLRRNPGGFLGLARIVTGQQVSLASAAAIWGRLEILADPFSARAFEALSDEQLRGAGLSRMKVKTLRGVADAFRNGHFQERDDLGLGSSEEIGRELLALKGIGPWTRDVYLMFCFGEMDGFAPGDLALQVAAEALMGLDTRPTANELMAIAERWRPWRGVAARLLWAYYREIGKAGSALPV